MSRFYMEIKIMNSVKVCSVSKAFSDAYGDGRLLGGYRVVAIVDAVWLLLRAYGGVALSSWVQPPVLIIPHRGSNVNNDIYILMHEYSSTWFELE